MRREKVEEYAMEENERINEDGWKRREEKDRRK